MSYHVYERQNGAPPRDGWHLDKKVPVAIIVALLSHAGMSIWWASAIDRRVEQLERQTPLRDDVIALKVKLENIEAILERMQAAADRAAQRRP